MKIMLSTAHRTASQVCICTVLDLAIPHRGCITQTAGVHRPCPSVNTLQCVLGACSISHRCTVALGALMKRKGGRYTGAPLTF
jgi:hypothetical protein